jgi:hypothetical protein
MGAGARHAVWYVCLRPSWAGGEGTGMARCVRGRQRRRAVRSIRVHVGDGLSPSPEPIGMRAHLVDVLFALFASCNNRLGVSIPN